MSGYARLQTSAERRAWALGARLGGFLAVLLVSDDAAGRTLYPAFASYHAYLELPVLPALPAAVGRDGPGRNPPDAAPGDLVDYRT